MRLFKELSEQEQRRALHKLRIKLAQDAIAQGNTPAEFNDKAVSKMLMTSTTYYFNDRCTSVMYIPDQP